MQIGSTKNNSNFVGAVVYSYQSQCEADMASQRSDAWPARSIHHRLTPLGSRNRANRQVVPQADSEAGSGYWGQALMNSTDGLLSILGTNTGAATGAWADSADSGDRHRQARARASRLPIRRRTTPSPILRLRHPPPTLPAKPSTVAAARRVVRFARSEDREKIASRGESPIMSECTTRGSWLP